MSIISAQKFAGSIVALRKLDDKAREMVSGIIAYALFQYHAHNNKTPFLTLTSTHADKAEHLNANLPSWLTSGLRKHVKLGTRAVAKHTEGVCEHMGDTYAAVIFASEEERKAQRKLAREAKAATPKAEAAPKAEAQVDTSDTPAQEAGIVVDGECHVVPLPESCLVIGGEVIQVTHAEADALYDTLMALRSQMAQRPVLRVAA